MKKKFLGLALGALMLCSVSTTTLVYAAHSHYWACYNSKTEPIETKYKTDAKGYWHKTKVRETKYYSCPDCGKVKDPVVSEYWTEWVAD